MAVDVDVDARAGAGAGAAGDEEEVFAVVGTGDALAAVVVVTGAVVGGVVVVAGAVRVVDGEIAFPCGCTGWKAETGGDTPPGASAPDSTDDDDAVDSGMSKASWSIRLCTYEEEWG